MFTGIIQDMGEVVELTSSGGDVRLRLRTDKLELSDIEVGDSIAVNGVCLTVVNLCGDGFNSDVSRETLAVTTLGHLKPGSRVNLEKALRLADRLGGHLVSGHVDGMGVILDRQQDARSVRFAIEAPSQLGRYIAGKGSITVDGTSLTVNAVSGARFEINIVPHTLQQTLFGQYRVGDRVNLEVDLLARYLERLLLGTDPEQGTANGLTEERLRRAGFIKD